jgi:hypothetical protein
MPTLVHETHGRLRFTVPGIEGDHQAADGLIAMASNIPGVKQVRVNLLTESLVIQYDNDLLTRSRIIETLGAEDKAARAPVSRVAELLAHAIAKELIAWALYAAVAVVI